MAESSRLVAAPPTATAAAAPKASSGGEGGGGTSTDTIMNIVNIAFGAGMLGLPYAIQGSGLVSGTVGLGVVLLWNFFCCSLLVELRKEVLIARAEAEKGTSLSADVGTPVSFAAIGSYAMGSVGTILVYISVVVTLMGAATAYFINANELLRATHLYLNPGWSEETAMYVNTFIYMCLMYPLTCIKSLAPLSRLSLPAIVALVVGFAVIIKLGLEMYGWPPMEEVLSWDALYIPQTFDGFSTFFGVAAFSYGATIIIPEIQASYAKTEFTIWHPRNTEEFIDALKTSLWIIWSSYSVLGGVALLIYQQNGPVSDNIMSQLPSDSPAQEPLLFFITIATLFTYPLAMQPVSSIFEQALIKAGFGQASARVGGGDDQRYGALTAAETGTDPRFPKEEGEDGESHSSDELSPALRYGLRAALVLFTGVCATSVPNFGVVVTLLGSFSVTLGSFVLPPLFHRVVFGERLSSAEKTADEVLCFIGAVTCVFTTTTTALGVLRGE
ncbi:unnamed protein product [Ectocarpus fasciculatus]